MRDAFDKKDPKNWQSCPECGGYGQIIRDFGQPYSPVEEFVYIDCSVCQAIGCIPTPHAFVEAHQDLKRELADLLDTTEVGVQYLLVQMEALAEEEEASS